MKRFVVALMTASLLAVSGGAWAGGYGHHYSPPRHYSYGHHHSHSGAYLLGGVVLGAVLADAFYRPAPPTVVYVERSPYYRPRVIYREETVTVPVPAQRSLLRDLKGNCFEISSDRDGNELRKQVSASECNW
jgi:hypothetical protein